MSLLDIFGKNRKIENKNKNKDDIEITATYNLNEIIGAHESKDQEEVAKTNKIEKQEKSEVPFTIVKEPIEKTIFVFDEAFDSNEGNLIKRIVRKQKGISFFSISKKESFEIMSKLYKNEGEDLIIIKGNYKNIASDIEIENFLEKILNNKKSKILRRSLSLENCKNENKDYRWMIRNYLKKLNIEAGLNIRVKKGLEKKVEEKIEEEYSENKCDKKIIDIPKPLEVDEPKVEMPTEVPDFVKEILEEENPIEFIFTGAKIDKEKIKKNEENDTLYNIVIDESYRSKISLTNDELKKLSLAISYAWKKMFPWCEVEINENDFIRIGDSISELVDAISFKLKERETGKYTGDVIKVNNDFFVIWRNGRDYYAKPTEKIAPLLVDVAKKYNFNEKNLAEYINPLIEQVFEHYVKKKGVTIEQIVTEKGKDAKEFECKPGVAYVDFSDMFVKDITACIEEIAESKGSLAGLVATEEYKAPDSNNAGEIYLKREDPKFADVFKHYPKLDKLKSIATGPLFINAIVEAYHSNINIKIKKLEEAALLVKTLPKEYQSIAYSVIMEMKKESKHTQSNAQSKLNKITCA
ncbi:MAG: hypothetical protein QW484_03465 [Candidatus Pacearchaeota archaeon]